MINNNIKKYLIILLYENPLDKLQEIKETYNQIE
jgi:hypothetical protein